jgi:methylmalonyl-CoA/ethylmalonyl-CoA epimerase
MKLTQVAQRATDLDRAATFYSKLLGSEPVARFDPPGLLFYSLDGTRLLLDSAAPSALLYLQVDSVRDRIEALRSDGVTIVSEPHVIFEHDDDSLGPAGTAEWMGFFEDSEGNTVGLISHEPPA